MFLWEPIAVVGLVAATVALVLGFVMEYQRRELAARVLAVLSAMSAIVGLVGVTALAQAAPLIYPNPNPAGTSEVRNSQLPTCAGTAGTKANEMKGQGWTGSAYLPVQIGTRTAVAWLMLPCWQAGTQAPTVQANMYVLTDTGTFQAQSPTVRISRMSYQCNGVTRNVAGVPFNWNGGIPNSTVNTWYQGAVSADTFCSNANDRLGEIKVTWQTYFNGTQVIGTATWRPQAWTDGAVKDQFTSVGNVPLPSGQETPVLCTYLVDTTDLLTILGSFFTQFGPWVGCLFTPAGWDRSSEIPPAFELGGVSQVGTVLTAFLPLSGSIFCGDVQTLPVFGHDVPINTCPLATAIPAWAKIATSVVISVALLFIMFRRFQWTVQK